MLSALENGGGMQAIAASDKAFVGILIQSGRLGSWRWPHLSLLWPHAMIVLWPKALFPPRFSANPTHTCQLLKTQTSLLNFTVIVKGKIVI